MQRPVENRQQEKELRNLLEEYEDIRDGIEDALQSFEIMSADIGFAMDDIRDELESLQVSLNQCSVNLKNLFTPARLSARIDKEPNEYRFDK